MATAISIIGCGLCAYAIYVELSHASGICDINETVSCSYVMKSKYSRMARLVFDLPRHHPLNLSNAEYGLVFYGGLAVMEWLPIERHQKDMLWISSSVVACLTSLGLAWVLHRHLKRVCLVCLGLYGVNGLLMWHSVGLLRHYLR